MNNENPFQSGPKKKVLLRVDTSSDEELDDNNYKDSKSYKNANEVIKIEEEEEDKEDINNDEKIIEEEEDKDDMNNNEKIVEEEEDKDDMNNNEKIVEEEEDKEDVNDDNKNEIGKKKEEVTDNLKKPAQNKKTKTNNRNSQDKNQYKTINEKHKKSDDDYNPEKKKDKRRSFNQEKSESDDDDFRGKSPKKFNKGGQKSQEKVKLNKQANPKNHPEIKKTIKTKPQNDSNDEEEEYRKIKPNPKKEPKILKKIKPNHQVDSDSLTEKSDDDIKPKGKKHQKETNTNLSSDDDEIDHQIKSKNKQGENRKKSENSKFNKVDNQNAKKTRRQTYSSDDENDNKDKKSKNKKDKHSKTNRNISDNDDNDGYTVEKIKDKKKPKKGSNKKDSDSDDFDVDVNPKIKTKKKKSQASDIDDFEADDSKKKTKKKKSQASDSDDFETDDSKQKEKPKQKKKSQASDSDDFEADDPKQKTKSKRHSGANQAAENGNEKKLKKRNPETIKKIDKRKKMHKETINFTTYIELDMHGFDPTIKKVLDWVPVIRDALYNALDKGVDIVSFIPGKGLHSDPKRGPVLKPLVLLTTKRLGFDSYINPKNTGVVICPITSHKEKDQQNDKTDDDSNDSDDEKLMKTFNVYDSIISTKGYDKTDDDDSDDITNESEVDKKAVKAVINKYPKMPKICARIICTRRTKKNALKFAGLFEFYLHKNKVKKDKTSIKRDNMLQIKAMNRVEKLENEYGFDRQIIEKVVYEKKNSKLSSIRAVLDRIVNEVPEDSYEDLTDWMTYYGTTPTETLLDAAQKNNYDSERISSYMNSMSAVGASHALNVLCVSNSIKTNRKDGNPKFIPSVEIDISHCGIEKAKRSILRILNGLCNGNFSEMVLQFNNNNDRKYCRHDEIVPFVKENVNDSNLRIREEKKKNRFHFFISQSESDAEIEEEDDNDDFDQSLYYSTCRKIHFK